MNWLERKIPLPSYDNPIDERINTDTHLVGTLLALFGLALVIRYNEGIAKLSLRSAMIIYALSNILLYASSTMYHALRKGNAKRIFRIFDHSNIYILIARREHIIASGYLVLLGRARHYGYHKDILGVDIVLLGIVSF